MGRFNYPSPYWDSIGDPALDLIDRMLTVDVDKRITIDECLEHPWVTNSQFINPADSTDGLTGQMGKLDFSKRKAHRERTLLSTINDIKVSKTVEADENQRNENRGPSASPTHINVWEKNPGGKNVHMSPSKVKGKARGKAQVKQQRKEETPAANRGLEEFMEMGGKGDMTLFGDDISSRYLPDEVPKKA